MAIHIHNDDLPETIDLGASIAIDTETMGLNPHRDRLCLVQLSAGDGDAHLVKIAHPRAYAPHLTALLGDPARTKLFHFARFDVAVLEHNIGPIAGDIYCTKIASKLARSYSDNHSLKTLIKEFINVDINKQFQNSDFGGELTPSQMKYCANDVIYLHKIHKELNNILEREKRIDLYKDCLKFLKTRVELDLALFKDDIWSH